MDWINPPHTNLTNYQIRSSSFLLLGELCSKAVDAAILILTVRYLSKNDYGAFAYALSIVKLAEILTSLGLNRAINRFLPIYHEQRDYHRLFGLMLMVVSAIFSMGLALVLLVHGFQGLIAQSVITDQQAFALLLILIVLAPVQALDTLLMSMFAVFARPRAIFFRKYVLAPGLQLMVVFLLIGGGRGVSFLASGYLVAGTVGVAIYAGFLLHVLREQGLYQHFNLQTIKIPARKALTFTLPLFITDLLHMLMNALDALLLGHFRGTAEVAAYRAVQPVARLNEMVFWNFALLFTPLAVRLLARNDQEGLNHLYWQTAAWIAVISFPIFALTFMLAHPLTVIMYGTRYEQSAVILSLLSFGYYFQATLGFNGITLMVFGKVRYLVTLSVIAFVVNLGANLLLIPRYGALGAAIGTGGTLVVHCILKQFGLMYGTGISLFRFYYFKIYFIISMSILVLLLAQKTMSSFIYVCFPMVVLAFMILLRLSRQSLDIARIFPELKRFSLARRLFGE